MIDNFSVKFFQFHKCLLPYFLSFSCPGIIPRSLRTGISPAANTSRMIPTMPSPACCPSTFRCHDSAFCDTWNVIRHPLQCLTDLSADLLCLNIEIQQPLPHSDRNFQFNFVNTFFYHTAPRFSFMILLSFPAQ